MNYNDGPDDQQQDINITHYSDDLDGQYQDTILHIIAMTQMTSQWQDIIITHHSDDPDCQ